MITGNYVECTVCGATAGEQSILEEEGKCKTCGAVVGIQTPQHQQRTEHHIQKDSQRSTLLNQLQKDIKRAARKDKKDHLLDQFRENKEDKHKKTFWKAIKSNKNTQGEVYPEVHTNEKQKRDTGTTQAKSRSNCRLPGKQPLV